MPEPKSNKWKKIFRLTGTILSIVLLAYLFYSVGWKEISTGLKELSLSRIIAVVVIIFISRLATFARWHMLLQVEQKKVNWKDSLRLTMAGLFIGNFLPTTIGGDVVRLAGAVRLGIDAALAAASLVVDRLIGMTGMALALPFGLIQVSSVLNQTSQQVISSTKFLSLAVWNQKIFGGIKKLITKAIESFVYWYKHPTYLLLALFFTFIHMICLFGIIKILTAGMNEQISFWTIAGLWSLTYFITLIPISVNGIGLQELSFVNLFTIFGGLTNSTALTVALFIRILMMIGSAPGAFFISGILSGQAYTKLDPNLVSEVDHL